MYPRMGAFNPHSRPCSGRRQRAGAGHRRRDPAPDGRSLVFLSYEKEVTGHPPDKDGTLRRLILGTKKINVPCWAPDGRRIAFGTYQAISRGNGGLPGPVSPSFIPTEWANSHRRRSETAHSPLVLAKTVQVNWPRQGSFPCTR